MTTDLRTRMIRLNEFLTSLYGTNMRLSLLLVGLGFTPEQVETLAQDHAERIVDSLIGLVKERLISVSDGDRLFFIITRRYGLDGEPPGTLRTVAASLSISGERVRQLERKVLRRCRSKPSRRFLEGGLRVLASGRVGPPGGEAVILPLDLYRGATSSANKGRIPNHERPVVNGPTGLLDRTFELAKQVLDEVPDGLTPSLLAHILFGSRGPVVDALVAEHGFKEYGALRSVGHEHVRELIAMICEKQDRFQVVEGRVKAILRSATRD